MVPINTLNKAAVGLFGFTVQMDLTTLLMDRITSVQVGKYPSLADPQVLGSFPAPVTSEVTWNVLQSYLNNENAPRLAFNHSNSEVTIFCKNADGISDYAYSTRYRVGDYVNHVIEGSATEAIWKCVTEGVSAAEEEIITYEWLVSGVTETSGLQWIFVDYMPITDTIAYAATTFIEVFGYRNTQACVNESDKLDVPDKDINLVLNYALATVWNMKKNYIPVKIQNIIDELELRIINE